mmetsp:Transcript_6094/g.14960  ORF Transcript_6094/g.14960 Transcript_6094/m.14960 type:complete len:130 (+) Transcript_6094:70-459(+)
MDPVTFAEVVPGRLYFGAIKGGAPKSTENTYYFCTDNTLAYEPFFKDFGPLSMGQVYRFCVFLRKTMDDPNFAKRKIVYVCDPHPHKRANAAVNIGAFAVFVSSLQLGSFRVWVRFKFFYLQSTVQTLS